jgi:hypothetical protein
MGLTFRLGQVPLAIFTDTSNNVGIGAAANASFKLQVTGATNLTGALSGTSATFNGNLNLQGAVTRNINFYDSSNTNINAQIQYDQIASNSGQLFFGTNNAGTFATRLTIASTGNVGIGITPSAWYTGYTALQVGFSGSIFSNRTSADTNTTMIGNNAFLNSAATNWIYQNNGFATRYTQVSGGHEFYTAASGTAGNAITWGTAKMTITSGGNVGIGTSSPSARLDVRVPLESPATNAVALIAGTSNGVNDIFRWFDGATQLGVFKNNGNVGIGTSSPSQKLQVAGYGFFSGASRGVLLGEENCLIIGDSATTNASNMIFYTANTERMRITSAGNTQPGADNAYSLGVSGTRWSAVWAANGTIQTSDEREKKDIIDADLGLDFISKLRPVSFKWKVGQNIVTSEVVKDEEGNPILDEEGKEKTESVIVPREGKRTHYGLIAQEVEELLDGKDFGGFIHDEETNIKGLRYDQFVPLLIKAIQEQQAQIEELRQIVATK